MTDIEKEAERWLSELKKAPKSEWDSMYYPVKADPILAYQAGRLAERRELLEWAKSSTWCKDLVLGSPVEVILLPALIKKLEEKNGQ